MVSDVSINRRHVLARFERQLFASRGDEPRRRRVNDGFLLGLGTVLAWLASVVARGPRAGEAIVGDGLTRAVEWLDPFWSVAYAAVTGLCVAFVLLAFFGGRRALTRDLGTAALLSVGVSAVLTRLLQDAWPSFADNAWRQGDPSYPAIRIAAAIALVVVASPDLTRPARRVAGVIAATGAFAALALGTSLPTDVVGGLAVGLAIGAGVRLVFGSSAGFPSEARVEGDLGDLRASIDSLERSQTQREGVASYVARRDVDGREIKVKVYGRDARDTQLLARLWRLLWYRDARRQISFTRLQLVEHEALMLFAAAARGVAVPAVVAVGTASSGDALLVTEQSNVPTLAADRPDVLTDERLEAVFSLARGLRAAGIAHGHLNTDSLFLVDGQPLVTEFQVACLSAPAASMDGDLAELIVSVAMIVGNPRAISAALTALGRDSVSEAVPYLQRAALTPALRNAARHAHFDLDTLHKDAAAATDTKVDELAALRRVTLRQIALVVLIAIAAYSMVALVAQIGLKELLQVLASAKLAWVAAAIVIAEATLLTDALCMQAAVSVPLPFGPTTLLESAIKFLNLSTPSSTGKIALNIRFLQLQGADAPTAVTQGALDGVVGFIVQALILLILLPTVDFHVDTSGDHDASGLFVVGVVLIVGIVIAAVIGAFLPAVRARVAPFIAAGRENLRVVLRSPRRAAQLFGANFGSQLLYALCLGASVRAFGQRVSLPELLLVNTGVSLFAGVMPVPGGVGVAEAGITVGLAAFGVPPDIAMAAAIIHRLATSYLPPVPGGFALRWLGTHGYV